MELDLAKSVVRTGDEHLPPESTFQMGVSQHRATRFFPENEQAMDLQEVNRAGERGREGAPPAKSVTEAWTPTCEPSFSRWSPSRCLGAEADRRSSGV